VNRPITKEMWAAVPVAETKRASLALQAGRSTIFVLVNILASLG
jgi:hypothetical protein